MAKQPKHADSTAPTPSKGDRTIKTQAKMPKGAHNGLTQIAEQLAAEHEGRAPQRMRAALVIFDTLRVSVEKDGSRVVTVEIRRIEPLLDQDLGEAEKFIRRSLGARMGDQQLPLDFEDDLEGAFGGHDFDNPPGPDEDDNDPGEDDSGDEGDLGGEA
jgi:hypothetical protein